MITWTATRQASLSFTISWSLLKLMSIESVMPSNHLILCCPLLLLPSIFPSIRQLISLCATTTFFQEHQVMCDRQCFCPCLTHLSLSIAVNPWVWKIPWRRVWQPTPVFLPGESHGQRSLVGYSP